MQNVTFADSQTFRFLRLWVNKNLKKNIWISVQAWPGGLVGTKFVSEFRTECIVVVSGMMCSWCRWCVLRAEPKSVLTTVFLSYNFKLGIGTIRNSASTTASTSQKRNHLHYGTSAMPNYKFTGWEVFDVCVCAYSDISASHMRHRGVAVLKVKQWSYTYVVSFIALNGKLEIIYILNTALHIPHLWTIVRYSLRTLFVMFITLRPMHCLYSFVALNDSIGAFSIFLTHTCTLQCIYYEWKCS